MSFSVIYIPYPTPEQGTTLAFSKNFNLCERLVQHQQKHHQNHCGSLGPTPVVKNIICFNFTEEPSNLPHRQSATPEVSKDHMLKQHATKSQTGAALKQQQ